VTEENGLTPAVLCVASARPSWPRPSGWTGRDHSRSFTPLMPLRLANSTNKAEWSALGRSPRFSGTSWH